MKYVVKEYTETISNGIMSESDEWEFDTYGAARTFFDGYDIVNCFETEVASAGRINAKDKKFVCELAETEEDEYGFFENVSIIDAKEASLKDID